MKTTPVSIVLVGLWTPVLCAAEPEAPRGGIGKPGQDGPRQQWHKQFMEGWNKADTDGDGVISRAEFGAMTRVKNLPEDKSEVLFKRLDKDANANLSREELGRLFRPQEKPGPMVPRLGELDQNKDGKISLEEFKAGEVFKKLQPERQDALFKRLDVNGDGVISPQDTPPPGRPGGPGGPGQHDWRGLFRGLDQNADGTLTFEEFRRAPMLRALDEDAQEDRFEALDANRDLKLDVAEFAKIEPKGEGRGPGKPHQPDLPRRGEGPQGPPPAPVPAPPPAPAPPPSGDGA